MVKKKVYIQNGIILRFFAWKLILVVGTYEKELWYLSGNQPFHTGSQKIIDTEGRVENFNVNKFKKEVEIKEQNEN
jgi:hypothetical protein